MDHSDVQALIGRLRAFTLAMHERIRREAPDGLGMQHMLIMKGLITDGPATQTSLVERLGITKGAVSQAITTLETKGLVARRRDEDDARIQWVHPTDAAQAFKASMEARVTDLFADLFHDWTDADAHRMNQLLDGLLERAKQA